MSSIEKTILETKLRKIETERYMRLSQSFLLREFVDTNNISPPKDIDVEELVKTGETAADDLKADNQEILNKAAKSGGLGGSIAKGVVKGAAEAGIKKAAEKGIMAALSKRGIQTIPFIGSVASAISALAEGALFLKDLYLFAQKMQEVSGVELQGISSLIGEYTLIDASAEDLNKIADVLETSSIPQATAQELYSMYWQAMNRFKQFLVDLLFTFKEVSAGISIGAAITVSVLPIETAFKELLFFAHKQLKALKDNSPKVVSIVIDAVEFIAGGVIPVIGFLLSTERVAAFARIDDAMAKLANRGSRDIALDTVQGTVYGGKRVYDIATRIGQELADPSNYTEGKTYNFDKFEKIYK